MLCAVSSDPPVMEAEEINALASLLQVNDPGLGVLELKAQFSQDQPQRRKCRFGLLPRQAHHQQIICLCRVPGYAESMLGSPVVAGVRVWILGMRQAGFRRRLF